MKSFLYVAATTGAMLCQGFVVPYFPQSQIDVQGSSFLQSSALDAKKRRRRRKDADVESTQEVSNIASGALPDFDLDEDKAEEEIRAKKKIITNPDEVTPAMMGSADAPVGSIKDLIYDRALESKLEFDEKDADQSLPDLLAMSRRDNLNAPVGSKKARQAERRAAAIAAKESEDNSLFENLPFISDDQGKVRPVKVLEAGAWAGIIILFGWEVYLNSPFFDRAAPLAPVVFESLSL